MYIRSYIVFVLFILILLVIGRNLSFLPRYFVYSTPQDESNRLKNELTNFVKNKPGTYSISFYDFGNKSSFGINDQTMHTAASVNKVPIVAVLYYLVQNKKMNLDSKIVLQQADIQDYGTGSIRYQPVGTNYSLKTLARLALQQSDNTAAHILAQRIGPDKIQERIEKWGLTQTSIDDNKTTTADLALLFKKLYTGKLVNAQLTKELLSFLKDTTFEDRLPIALPANTTVYHKTGDAVGSIHDCGIIEKKDSAFFLCVLTTDIQDEPTTKKTIGEIAKRAYYFDF